MPFLGGKIMWNRSLVVAVAVAAMGMGTGAQSAPADGPGATMAWMPLDVRAAGPVTNDAGGVELSCAQVGRLPADVKAPVVGYLGAPGGDTSPGLYPVRNVQLINDIASGRVVLGDPESGADVMVLAVFYGGGASSPVWGPVALSRNGNTFTLVMEVWERFLVPVSANPMVEDADLVNLGALPEGTYNLRLEIRGMEDQFAPEGASKWSSLRTGESDFTVHNPGTVVQSIDHLERKPIITEGDMRDAPAPPEAAGKLYQRPLTVDQPAPAAPPAAAGLAVPWVSLPTHSPSTRTDLPTYEAVITGPRQNSGEWMSLRSVEWTGSRVVLHVDVWNDDGPRRKSIARTPVLTVWLNKQIPGKAAEWTVEVAWNPMRANTTGGLYYPDTGKTADLLKAAKNVVKVPGPNYR